jgi:hypothetical protein
MSYTIYFYVTTQVSTNPAGPLPNAKITWPGDNNVGATSGSDGTAFGTVITNDNQNKVACTASAGSDYSTQTLTGSSANDKNHPLVFHLQGYGWIPCGPHGPCFIVSAATGSPDSAEVRQMQQMRARVAGVSALSGQLIAEILREYYQFSPEIAAHIDKDEAARRFVLGMVVRPLMAWYSLAVSLGLELSDAKTAECHVHEALDACAVDPSSFSIPAVLEAIRSGKPLPEDSPGAILPFMDRAREAARLRSASWAILDPLVRLWTLRERRADVVDELSEWLGNAPLETLLRPEDPDVLDNDLKTLSGFFDFRPAARRQLGIRLASAWPETVPALARNGFLSEESMAT